MRGVEIFRVVLDLAKDVRERSVEVPLIDDRADARGLEADAVPQVLLKADLNPPSELARVEPARDGDDVHVRIGEREGEQPKWHTHAIHRTGADPARPGAWRDRSVVFQPHRDVVGKCTIQPGSNGSWRASLF